MKHDTGRTRKNPGVSDEVRDVLTEVLRQGAQQLISQAVETEVEEFLRQYREMRDEAGRRRLVPKGYLPPPAISTGDFSEALTALLGPHAPGLSAGTISRLKAVWQDEHARWEQREIGNTPYAYIWVDGIHFGVRLEEANQCILVVIGATAEGTKELLALTDGFRG